MSYKRVEVVLLCSALAFFSETGQSLTLQPGVTVTPEAKVALAHQAAKDGSPTVKEEIGGLSGKPSAQTHTDTAAGLIAADMKLVPKADVKKYAASHFLAFYNIRTRTDPDVCRAEGVDLASYVLAFKLTYAVEFARADMLTVGSRFSNAQVLSDLHAERERGEAVSRRVLLTLASRLGKTTIADGCEYLVAHAADSFAIQSFAEEFPELEAILMSD